MVKQPRFRPLPQRDLTLPWQPPKQQANELRLLYLRVWDVLRRSSCVPPPTGAIIVDHEGARMWIGMSVPRGKVEESDTVFCLAESSVIRLDLITRNSIDGVHLLLCLCNYSCNSFCSNYYLNRLLHLCCCIIVNLKARK